MLGVLLLAGVLIVVVQSVRAKDKPAAEDRGTPSASTSSVPPDGTYCYGCFYTTTLPAFRAQAETAGYTCETEGTCRKGTSAVLTFRPSAAHPTRLGSLSVRTFTPGGFDRAKGNALAIAATNAELKVLLARVFVDPAIHQAVIEWFGYSMDDCDPLTLTGFRLTCTPPKTSAVTTRSATWTAEASIEGEYNR